MGEKLGKHKILLKEMRLPEIERPALTGQNRITSFEFGEGEDSKEKPWWPAENKKPTVFMNFL